MKAYLNKLLVRAFFLWPFVQSTFVSAKSLTLEFVLFEDNPNVFLELSKARPEFFSLIELSEIDLSFDYLFSKLPREQVRTWVSNLYLGVNCGSLPSQGIQSSKLRFCKQLQMYWDGPLMQTYYFDASIVQLSRARELLDTAVREKNLKQGAKHALCRESFGIIQEVEAQEGVIQSSLELQLKVFECLGDEAGRLDVYRKIETLRNIKSALGT